MWNPEFQMSPIHIKYHLSPNKIKCLKSIPGILRTGTRTRLQWTRNNMEQFESTRKPCKWISVKMSIFLCSKINILTHNFWFAISMAWPKYWKWAPTILSKQHPKKHWDIQLGKLKLPKKIWHCRYKNATPKQPDFGLPLRAWWTSVQFVHGS